MFVGEKQDPIKVILLSIITCGIYGLIWLANTGKDVNKALGRDNAVNTNLVWISILCFPVIFYYLYTLDQALLELGQQRGVAWSSNFLLWILLSILAGVGTFVAYYQIQTFLNTVWEQPTAPPAYE